MFADSGLLPKPLAKLDVYGTPRTAVIVSAVFYSRFALLTFSNAPVFACALPGVRALIRLRKIEPSLRVAFRIPLRRAGVPVLAALPMIVLIGVGVSIAERGYGLRAIIGASVAVAAG